MNCYKCGKKDLTLIDTIDLNIYDGLIPNDHECLINKPAEDFDHRITLCQTCYKKFLEWITKNA